MNIKLLGQQMAWHMLLGDLRMQLFKQVRVKGFSMELEHNAPFKQVNI